jgi:hypothetical protein
VLEPLREAQFKAAAEALRTQRLQRVVVAREALKVYFAYLFCF